MAYYILCSPVFGNYLRRLCWCKWIMALIHVYSTTFYPVSTTVVPAIYNTYDKWFNIIISLPAPFMVAEILEKYKIIWYENLFSFNQNDFVFNKIYFPLSPIFSWYRIIFSFKQKDLYSIKNIFIIYIFSFK